MDATEEELKWELLEAKNGSILAARMEDTEDGWECTAVKISAGVEMPKNRTTETAQITIVSGRGRILHNNQFKSYGPNQHYIYAQDQLFFLHAEEDTLFALTVPQ